MAVEQQVSNGFPPATTANLNVKPNTSPASRLASTVSTTYNIPLNSHPATSNITYQALLETSQPTNPASIESFSTSNDFSQIPPTAGPPSPASSCDFMSSAGATYSPFENTFVTLDMAPARVTLGSADSSNPDAITQPAFKRKAETDRDTPTMETLKRIKATDSASPMEEPGLNDGSLTTILPTELIVQEIPSSRNAQVGPSVVKRNVGGRPKTAPLKPKKPVGPTRLRKNKPVAAAVHMDIWELILPYCPLRFLFTVRNVNKLFRERLAYGSLWKKCRIQNYGTDMPDPLPGMKEWDYANLVEGLGCMSCQNKRSRKTYWAFQKRWCAKCLTKNTILDSASWNILSEHPKILECIPHGTFDSWGHYESTGWHRSGHGQQRGYELAAITTQLQEIENFLDSGEDGKVKSDEQIDAWYAPRIEANLEFMTHVQQIENWLEKNSREKVRGAGNQKLERGKFYKAHALSMDPPLQAAAMERIPAYQRAVNISRAPSERSWQLLLPKLKEGRAAAEKLIREEQERLDRAELNQELCMEYANIRIHRSNECSPEQKLVLELADEVLSNLRTEIPIVPIDDADFVLLVLRAVREKYYRLAESERPDAYGTGGKHRLLLDDAKLVYERRISREIDDWLDSARSKAARLFKCPGCTRTDINLRYSFGQLFCHLSEKHAGHIGDFSILRVEKEQLPVGVRFPWCRLEWPFKLPILAEHHNSTGRWNPDDTSDYILAPPKPAKTFTLTSAFEQRLVSATAGSRQATFVDNIIYAATLLRHTPLVAKYQTQIALKFAVDKAPALPDEPSTIEDLAFLDLARIRTGNYALFDDFRCKACCDTPEPARNNKFVNKCQPFGELANHFKTHHFHLSWISHMLVLPSAAELWHALTEPEMEPAMDVFDKLFPRREERFLDPTLRSSLKAPVANMLPELPE